MSEIAENLKIVRTQIDQAAVLAGRDPQTVKLIAVSKTKPMSLIQAAWQAEQVDFGENRPQELRDKHPELPNARWHMIGTLQRNKVKYLIPWISLIHSVDSEKLLAEINKQAAKSETVINILLQLNISEEDAKSGLNEDRSEDLLRRIDEYPYIRVNGLMGMAELTEDDSIVRSQFRRLRMAKERLLNIQHPRIQLEELSMGMSGDFKIAIEEGATMVRIGSAIFGGRN